MPKIRIAESNDELEVFLEMVKNVDLHHVFLQLEVLEAMITVTPNQWEVTTMGVAGRMLPQGASWTFFSELLHSFSQQITTKHGKYEIYWNINMPDVCENTASFQLWDLWILPWNAMFFFLICIVHSTQKWDVYWPCYGRLCLIFQYQFPRLWEPESGWWSRCQNIYMKRRLCDSVLTSISEISLKGIDIESCNHRFSRDWLIRFNSQPFVVGQKFCRSHRWCLHRTCDGGFLVPFVGSDGWSLGRSLGGKQSPCLCSSDLAGKGRGNVKLKKWGPKVEYGNNETGDLSSF